MKEKPARFWIWYYDDDLESAKEELGKGNFGLVIKRKFKDIEYLKKNKQNTTYADQNVAVKDPRSNKHDWLGNLIVISFLDFLNQ